MSSKRRPYSRLSDSIWREPWPARPKLAIYNLIAYLHERWRTDGLDADAMFPIKIGWREAGAIFGGNSIAATLQGVEQVGTCIGCSYTATDQHLEWSWPKWVKEQGLGAQATPDQHPSASSVQRPASIVKDSAPAEPVAPRAKRARKEIGPVPESLTQEQRLSVRAWAEKEHRWAVSRLLALESACLDHHRGNGNKAKITDWPAALRTWIRRQPEFAPRTTPPSATVHVRPIQAQRAMSDDERAARDELARRRERSRSELVAKPSGAPGLGSDLRAILGDRA